MITFLQPSWDEVSIFSEDVILESAGKNHPPMIRLIIENTVTTPFEVQ
jgi:hypothetical protein